MDSYFQTTPYSGGAIGTIFPITRCTDPYRLSRVHVRGTHGAAGIYVVIDVLDAVGNICGLFYSGATNTTTGDLWEISFFPAGEMFYESVGPSFGVQLPTSTVTVVNNGCLPPDLIITPEMSARVIVYGGGVGATFTGFTVTQFVMPLPRLTPRER